MWQTLVTTRAAEAGFPAQNWPDPLWGEPACDAAPGAGLPHGFGDPDSFGERLTFVTCYRFECWGDPADFGSD